jgi:hypothetical protein
MRATVRDGEDFKRVRKESQFYLNKLHSPLKYKTLYEEEEGNRNNKTRALII